MSTPRKLGVVLCLLGFAAVCVMAMVLNTNRPFAGLGGIQADIADQALIGIGDDAPGAEITVSGREVTVELPEVVAPGFDRDGITERLSAIDGVRSVELVGDPVIAAVPVEPSAEDPSSDPEPTPEPAPDPTAVPEPTAEPAPDPTVEPEPTEVPELVEPTLDEIVAGLDLANVNFEPGTARFTAEDTAVLDGIADQLQGQSGGPVQVQAHTDNVGDPDVNLLLSQDRAAAVVAYLIDRGVDASLLTSRGFGAQVPIADNETEQGRAANQRVMLVVEGN